MKAQLSSQTRLGLTAFCLLASAITGLGQMTRQQAVNALLSPGSGVTIYTNLVQVWCPYTDFGGGSIAHLGLLPTGSQVGPRFDESGTNYTTTEPLYFFWVDDAPPSAFAHDVRFVFMRAGSGPIPTVTNGGIVVYSEDWWPVIALPGGSPVEYFATDQIRTTASPVGANNPDGQVAGPAVHPDDVQPLPGAPFALISAPAPSKACGLIIVGASDVAMENSGKQAEKDLKDHYGVEPGRIKKPNGGKNAKKEDVEMAIQELCALMPACDKIYVRVNSHGAKEGGIQMGNAVVSPSNFCNLVMPLGTKGAKVCMIIDSCFAGQMVDAKRWGFPAGSVIITSSTNDRTALTGPYTNGSLMPFSDAFSKCLNSTNPAVDTNHNGKVDDLEAVNWVLTQNPCYSPSLGSKILSNLMVYPAGDATGWPPRPAGISSNDWNTITNKLKNPGPQVFHALLPRLNIQELLDRFRIFWSIHQTDVRLEENFFFPNPLRWQPVQQEPLPEGDDLAVYVFRQPSARSHIFRLGPKPPEGDATPPELTSAQFVNPNQVRVGFSEPVDPLTANQSSNYTLFGPNQVNVMGANIEPGGQSVILFVNPQMVPGSGYQLRVNNIRDLAGNVIAPNSTTTFNTPNF